MAEVRRGHQQALNELYDRFASRVYGMALQKLANSVEAQTVTHDIFLSLWRGSNSYSPDSGNLAGWLLTFAHNHINDHYRRNRGTGEIPTVLSYDPSSEAVSGENPGSEVAPEREDARIARQALQSLPAEEREVVVLAYYQGNSQSEISQQLSVPLDTVKSRMRSAVNRLRSTFTAGGVAK